jgi:hypothetical protein
MKAKYAHLIETGKPAKVALTAIMRKLVVLANALPKGKSPWDAKNRLINTDTLGGTSRATILISIFGVEREARLRLATVEMV